MNEGDYVDANAALDALLEAARTTAAEWQFEVSFLVNVESALEELKAITVPLRQQIAASIKTTTKAPAWADQPETRPLPGEIAAQGVARRFGGRA